MTNKRIHPGVGYAHPHAEAAKNVAGQTDQVHVKADLGKPPLPKRAFTTAPEIHSGMMAKSKSGVHFAGLSGQDLSRFDANPGDDPLAGAPRGKATAPVTPQPTMRSRNNDALASGEPGAAHDAHMANADAFTKGLRDMSAGILAEAGHGTNLEKAGLGAVRNLPQSTEEQ